MPEYTLSWKESNGENPVSESQVILADRDEEAKYFAKWTLDQIKWHHPGVVIEVKSFSGPHGPVTL